MIAGSLAWRGNENTLQGINIITNLFRYVDFQFLLYIIILHQTLISNETSGLDTTTDFKTSFSSTKQRGLSQSL